MPQPQPDLPEPAHPNIDSMLSRKFGKEIANYFSGAPYRLVVDNKDKLTLQRLSSKSRIFPQT